MLIRTTVAFGLVDMDLNVSVQRFVFFGQKITQIPYMSSGNLGSEKDN